MNRIHLNIKHLRNSIEANQEEFGRLFNVNRANVTSYERSVVPHIVVVNEILKYFNLTLDQLINSDLSNYVYHKNKKKSIVQEDQEIYGNVKNDQIEQTEGKNILYTLQQSLLIQKETIEAQKETINAQKKTIEMFEKSLKLVSH
ncbi:helix-turn-helix domain-containing protein [Peijinzhouia sedimentorum]